MVQKYNTYLHEHQIDFLKQTKNASQIIRNALDNYISNEEINKQEKIIYLYNTLDELNYDVQVQEDELKKIKTKNQHLKNQLLDNQFFVKAIEKIHNDDYILEQVGFEAKYRVMTEVKGKKFSRALQANNEEEAHKVIKETVESILESEINVMEKNKEEFELHSIYLTAQEEKLQNLQKQLEKSKVTLKNLMKK